VRRLSPTERRVLVGLTLGSAGLTGDEISDPAIRWSHLGALATRHGVAPLVYRGLRALGRRGALPGPAVDLRDRCETLYVQTAARNTRLFAELERVLGPLRQAGIPVILLKGAAIAHGLFGDIGLRPMRDLDLLVPPEARGDALAALRCLGYRLVGGAPADLRARARRDRLASSLSAGQSAEAAAGLYERYHFHYYLEREGQTFPVELHWHIVKPGRGGPIDDFWHEARPIRVGELDALGFRPEHLLLHLALHLTADPYRELRLARLVDIHVAVATQSLDWAWLHQVARRQHAVRALGVALGLACRALGTAVPASSARLLGGFDAALVALLGRRWLGDLGLHSSDRMAPRQTLAWTIACRDRWSDVPGRLYRLLASYPETNARLPDRYRGSELMNALVALHPARVRRLLARARHRGRAASSATLSAVPKVTRSS
jgi:putative nucleotidyltransferase-like protein